MVENSKVRRERVSILLFSILMRERRREEEWGTAEIQKKRINPTNSKEHSRGWISSCKTELLTSMSSPNMKKWMISNEKLCSHSVKRKTRNTNTGWRNNICKVSYTVSIHISPYRRRGTTFWWRTQTPIKKWKQKKYF